MYFFANRVPLNKALRCKDSDELDTHKENWAHYSMVVSFLI